MSWDCTSLFAFETLCFFHTRLIEQSLLWVWQGLLLLHLSHNILHMTRTASGAPRLACSEKTGTNGHMSCCSQTHTTSSDPSHPQDNLRSCAMGIMLQTPRTLTKKTLGDRAFLAAAPKLWNGSPSQIRNEPNFHRFKGLLKTHFFRLAFY